MPLPEPTLYSVQSILNQIFNDTDGLVTVNTQPAASSIGHGRKLVTIVTTSVPVSAGPETESTTSARETAAAAQLPVTGTGSAFTAATSGSALIVFPLVLTFAFGIGAFRRPFPRSWEPGAGGFIPAQPTLC